jgi:DNA-binding GntR family transcriptional regulator
MPDSLTDQVYKTIKSAIIACELPPGQQFSQSQFMEKYATGLTPLREALQRLAQEGYLQVTPRFGYTVSPITLSDVNEIYEVRLSLETTAARLAAQRAPQADLQALAQSVHFTYTYGNRQSYTQFLAQNADFHLAVATASGNGRLVSAISKVLEELTRVFHLGLDLRDSAEEMHQEHTQLVQALLNRSPEQAEAITRSQILRSQERVLEALSRGPSRPVQLTPFTPTPT